MSIALKQSTASQEVPLGFFVDSTDGVTAETGLTIANTDIKIWKAGATTLANKNSGGATHISGGIYYAVLDATDTDTLGPLVLFVNVSGALPVRLECEVLAANVYDSLIAATDKLQADTVEVSGTSQTAGDLAALVTTVDDLLDTEVAAIKTVVDAVKAKTDNLPAAPAATGDIPSANTIADAVLKRDWTSVTGEASRSVLNALRAIRNKVSRSGSTLTVCAEDDSTEAWSASITTSSSAEAITEVDPS
jgi:hypothetical protein